MKHNRRLESLNALLVLGCCGLACCGRAQTAERTLLEWNFNRDGDREGWQPNAHLADVSISDGALRCRGAGADPILELQPLLDLPASPWQVLEIRLRANRDGVAEFFWSNTTQSRFGGFSPGKQTPLTIRGDDQWHTYRVFPFWHPEGKIVRLRFDPYAGAEFALDYLRVVQLEMPAEVGEAEFDFTRDSQGWQGLAGATVRATSPGLAITPGTAAGFALAPPLRLDAAERSFASLRLAVQKGGHATLFFATEPKAGWHTFAFPVVADGREHTYHLDLLAAPAWQGRILALGLRPTDAPDAGASLRSLSLAAEPRGPAELKVLSFALEDALPRAGIPATMRAVVANTGGAIASNIQYRLTLPPGVRQLEAAAPRDGLTSLGYGEELVLSWRIEASKPLTGHARLQLTATDSTAARSRAAVTFSPKLPAPKTAYVPEPKPLRGPYEVGVYYFPGWKSASQWRPLQRFPERKPVLGWYAEGSPEVADWHIKWAVEHGLTFFAYDWYWAQGARQLEHALHDGYFQARYRSLLKFCLLWANHNAPGSSSLDDCLAVTRYWIAHYFHRPEYLTIEGRPAVIIFSTDRLTQDLGSAQVKRALAAMRDECCRAGFKGLYLLACIGNVGQARQAAEEGYDAVTAYNWPGLGMTAGELFAPFASLLDGYRRHWRDLREQTDLPLLLPICGGWDSRPWHGDHKLVRYGRTPALFRRHLLDAKQLLDGQSARSEIDRMVLVEAWNEWGEGSYIEPHKEFGFGYLDAIRAVFTPGSALHTDVTPADIGLGPYDVPTPPLPQTNWDFTTGDQGWANVMDLAEARAANGLLTGRSTGNDPAFCGPPMQARSSAYTMVSLRLRLARADGRPFTDTAQLFWRTSRLPESEASSERFQVQGDGQWHDYRVPVAQNRRWRGVITRLRLDPCNQSGVTIELDHLDLEPSR
jgi:hypothetical protein